jgi:predicted Rossmann-fold nucleotide-binding protein
VISKYILNKKPINEIQIAELTEAVLVATSNNLYENYGHPKLFLSFTEGELNFPLKVEIKNAFELGLQNAAKKSRSLWIITGGVNAGIMRSVGESLAKKGLTVIGIPSYNRIKNFMKLQVQ